MNTTTEKSVSKKKYRFGKLFCMDCGYANTYDSEMCYSCGSVNLTRDKRLRKKKEILDKKPFIKSGRFYYLVSLGIAFVISIGIVFGVASVYEVIYGILAFGIVMSFTLLLSAFIFIFIRVFTKKEIPREKN